MGMGDSESVQSQLSEQLPVIQQINKEFRDPVSTQQNDSWNNECEKGSIISRAHNVPNITYSW